MLTLLRIFFTSQIAACASQTIDLTGSIMKSGICEFYFFPVMYLQSIIHRNIPFQVSSSYPKYSSERDFYIALLCVLQSIQIQFRTVNGLIDTDKLLSWIFNQNVQQNIFWTLRKGQLRFSGSSPILLKPYQVKLVCEEDFVRGIFHASPLFTRY